MTATPGVAFSLRLISEKIELEAEREALIAGQTDMRAEMRELRAENERLLAIIKAIERHTAPSTRTWDTCLRDMGLANDLARAAPEPKP